LLDDLSYKSPGTTPHLGRVNVIFGGLPFRRVDDTFGDLNPYYMLLQSIELHTVGWHITGLFRVISNLSPTDGTRLRDFGELVCNSKVRSVWMHGTFPQ